VRHRRLASLLAAVSVAGLAATGCGSTAAALQVDDESISRRDFEDQLDVVYENEAFRAALFGEVGQEQLRGEDDPLGSYTQQYVAAMGNVQIQFMVIPGVLADEGLEITEADREAVAEQLDGAAPGTLDGLPDEMREQYLDGFAGFDKLRAELGDDFEATVTAAIDDADIEVSSRYGSWDATERTIVPPTGPRPAPGGAGTGGSGDPADGSDLPAG
jgi:hypothetical protein